MKRRPAFLLLLLTISLCASALPARNAGAQQANTTAQQPGAPTQQPDAPAQQAPAAQAAATNLSLAGLTAPVTVWRDERGIPYIEAANEDDLFMAQGYVTASDRLWQMDLMRRNARGELAEIFGRAALEDDKRRRTYGFAALAEATYTQASPAARRQLEAYARGVNAFIAARDERNLPVEFRLLRYRPRAWTPADSVVLGKNFAEVLTRPWLNDIMRAALNDVAPERLEQLYPVVSPLDVLVVGADNAPQRRTQDAPPAIFPHRDAPATVAALALMEETMRRSFERVGLYAEEIAASNNWVVSGRRTVTGKPLLANDPHLAPSAPSIWYMTHLSAPGLRVAGVTSPGVPGIIIGHNEHIAWGLTNVGPDVADVYRERFDPENPRRYMTPAGWREATVRREEIRVRPNPADPATETVVHEVTVTRHGPVVFERDGARYALRWTALEREASELEAFGGINRARNWDEFRAGLRNYAGPTQNFIYADTSGNIGYYAAGRIPIRRTGDGSLPYDGTKDDGEWTGYIPFDRLPHVYNPPAGIIVTANSRIVGRDYPYFLTNEWASPYRARRILNLLEERPRLSVDDFRRIQADTYSIGGATFARAVVELARSSSGSNQSGAGAESSSADGNASAASSNQVAERDWRETVRLLESWDGRLEPDSLAAPLVVEMRLAFRRRILEHALGAERMASYRWANADTFFDRLIVERPRAWLPAGFADYVSFLRAVNGDARAALARRLGADPAQWTGARYAQARFPHPLAAVPFIGLQFAIPPVPQRGSASLGGATPNVGAGVSMRLIADTSDWDRTQQGIALGQSGDPASPHWRDQLEDWQAATPRVFPFAPVAVRRAARTTVTLTPATR